MKKTLIALMVLAGVACGAETITIQGIDAQFTSAPVQLGNCYSGDYTFTFTLTEDYTMNDFGTVLAFYRGSAVNDAYGYNAIYLGSTDEALTLSVGRGRVMGPSNFATATFDKQEHGTFDIALEKGVAYTLTATAREEVFYKPDGQVDHKDGYVSAVLTWDGGSVSIGEYKSNMNGDAALTVAVNPGTKTIQVPEPATATLSLLALAGMCARRRRA